MKLRLLRLKLNVRLILGKSFNLQKVGENSSREFLGLSPKVLQWNGSKSQLQKVS